MRVAMMAMMVMIGMIGMMAMMEMVGMMAMMGIMAMMAMMAMMGMMATMAMMAMMAMMAAVATELFSILRACDQPGIYPGVFRPVNGYHNRQCSLCGLAVAAVPDRDQAAIGRGEEIRVQVLVHEQTVVGRQRRLPRYGCMCAVGVVCVCVWRAGGVT